MLEGSCQSNLTFDVRGYDVGAALYFRVVAQPSFVVTWCANEKHPKSQIFDYLLPGTVVQNEQRFFTCGADGVHCWSQGLRKWSCSE